jgi:hypothetical protein
MDDLIKKYFDCFGHLDFEGILTAEEIFESGSFTEHESILIHEILSSDIHLPAIVH